MFARTSVIAMLALPLLAAATVLPRTNTPTTPASQCNPGNLQCCDSTDEPDALTGADIALLRLLGMDEGDVTRMVGLTCSPLTIIGPGTSSCTAKPVCCRNNSYNGVITLGCTPVDLKL